MTDVNETVRSLSGETVSLVLTRVFSARCAMLLALVLSLCVFTSLGVQAEKAIPQEMEQVCQNWLTQVVFEKGAWARETSPQIRDVHEIIVNDTVLARCFSIAPNGYVVVPVLKELPPVKACSEECSLDVNQVNGMPQLLRDVLLHRLRLFVKTYGSLEAAQPSQGDVLFDRINSQQWDRFSVGQDEFEAGLGKGSFDPMDQVGPLLTTTWDQSSPYNNYCPWGDGGRCVVGCVATAAAQIMAYHQWPEAGYGSYTYWWDGDYSCEGSTPGQWLSADFSDPYDWENIPNHCHGSGCSPAEEDALAELNYEVGVAFDMDYGHCGSGTWASLTAWETYFRYRDCMDMEYRSEHSPDSWFNVIKEQINNGQPMEYYITYHAIACDGWREIGDPVIKQYHMNYGWDDGHNAWYTLDNLYCPWEGCDYMNESMVRNIIPDRGIWLSAEPTFGWAPFDVLFTGSSEYSVDEFIWDFGDGDGATVYVDTVTHTYDSSGMFDVSLAIDTGGGTLSLQRSDYIIVLADSMIAVDTVGGKGDTVEVVIRARNAIPLNKIMIPFETFGTLNVTHAFNAFSTDGCRTDYFETQSYLHFDPGHKRYTIILETSSADLQPGEGSILKLYFNIPDTASSGQTDTVEMDGYLQYLPLFSGSLADSTVEYQALPMAGTISLSGCCNNDGVRGDFNYDMELNVGDVIGLVDYIFFGGDPPPCLEEGDVNGDAAINVGDVIHLVDYIFFGGQPPADCP